ncbi:hypothetical protein ILUMI_14170, partial [Ignelater luminosus]
KFLNYCYYKNENKKFEGTYQQLLNYFKVVSLQKRRQDAQMCFLYKIINGLINDQKLLLLIDFGIPSRQTRQTALLQYNTPKTNYRLQSPLISMCKQYNNISTDINIFGSTFNQFKRNLKQTAIEK